MSRRACLVVGIVGATVLVDATPASARSRHAIGLVQDVDAMSRADAMTTSARGGSALFLNPAGLVYNRYDLRLAGVEGIADRRLLAAQQAQAERARLGQASADVSTEDNLRRVYDLLQSDTPISAVATARLIDFVVPYVGVQTFLTTEAGSHGVPTAAEPTTQADLLLRTGAIAGFGIKLGKLALGYSRYALIESELEETVTTARLESIRQQVDADPTAAADIPYGEFSRATYGHTQGHNVGMLYHPFEDNPSGVGLAVLNVGGSTFRERLPERFRAGRRYEDDLTARAAEYGITLEAPNALPQIVNAGLLLGVGGDRHDALTANLALDYDDLGGDYLAASQKFAASTELGVLLPDELAMLTRVRLPYYDYNKKSFDGSKVYVGILGLKATAGVRPHDRFAYGVAFLGHAGSEHLSFVKFGLQATREVSLQADGAERLGAQASVGLTLMWTP